ncbi:MULTISPECIES: hypothetical protein [unclassified Bradyrhizobium]|uniref:hypothetical protein n=1 Tax=unclassified Bradyrhizobium TaxID=2631580 RepID=UPI003391F557
MAIKSIDERAAENETAASTDTPAPVVAPTETPAPDAPAPVVAPTEPKLAEADGVTKTPAEAVTNSDGTKTADLGTVEQPKDETLPGTGTDNSPAVALSDPAVTKTPVAEVEQAAMFAPDEVSHATAVPPAPIIQHMDPSAVMPTNVSESISETPTASVATGAPPASGMAAETGELANIEVAKLPVITDPADVRQLKDGQHFLAKFAHDPEGDTGWSARQILKELMSGQMIRHGISVLFWQAGHHLWRSPIARKQGRNFIMID